RYGRSYAMSHMPMSRMGRKMYQNYMYRRMQATKMMQYH
nr:RecName: Full=Turripeptide GpIAa; Contains: RecName: Full=Turripeptide GpIAb [Cryptogemma periscelida]